MALLKFFTTGRNLNYISSPFIFHIAEYTIVLYIWKLK